MTPSTSNHHPHVSHGHPSHPPPAPPLPIDPTTDPDSSEMDTELTVMLKRWIEQGPSIVAAVLGERNRMLQSSFQQPHALHHQMGSARTQLSSDSNPTERTPHENNHHLQNDIHVNRPSWLENPTQQIITLQNALRRALEDLRMVTAQRDDLRAKESAANSIGEHDTRFVLQYKRAAAEEARANQLSKQVEQLSRRAEEHAMHVKEMENRNVQIQNRVTRLHHRNDEQCRTIRRLHTSVADLERQMATKEAAWKKERSEKLKALIQAHQSSEEQALSVAVESKRADEERKRADAEKRRADAEKRRADYEQDRANLLVSKLAHVENIQLLPDKDKRAVMPNTQPDMPSKVDSSMENGKKNVTDGINNQSDVQTPPKSGKKSKTTASTASTPRKKGEETPSKERTTSSKKSGKKAKKKAATQKEDAEDVRKDKSCVKTPNKKKGGDVLGVVGVISKKSKKRVRNSKAVKASTKKKKKGSG